MSRLNTYYHAEIRRRELWLPVAFAAGIALYFAWPNEPDRLWLAAGLLGVVALLILSKTSHLPFLSAGIGRFRPALWLVLLAMIGMNWAALQTGWRHQVVIEKNLPPQPLQGTIRTIERTPDGFRLTLDDVVLQQRTPEQTPQRIRISMRPAGEEMVALPPVGTRVEMLAGLLPPMGAALPGGFDFARFFYFNGIGAVGFGLPPLKVIAPTAGTSLAEHFWTWRSQLTDRVLRIGGAHIGPIAAGLITGDARALPEEDFEQLRASNLYHIIAISGEHMVMISGVIFILLRGLALLSPWRHRAAAKTIAAMLTLGLVTVYLFVTGLPVSAIRAYLMIALVLISIILRRQTNPLRSLFIAATLMLIWSPADLFDPGFQLSFSATLALISLITFRSRHFVRDAASRWQQLRTHIGTLLLASLVAELATTPFVLSQFNTLSIYGIFANTIATPLVSFLLMPLVALFFLLLPLGLSDAALWGMDRGIRALMAIAERVSHWPHALQALPSPPEWAVAAFAMGLLWLCIWQERWRLLALPVMLVALLSPLWANPPELLIGAELKQIAFRGAQGWVLAKGRPTSLLPKIWANGVGEVAFLPPAEDSPDWRCDPLGCVATLHAHGREKHIAFAQNAMAMADDCALSDLVVTLNNGSSCATTPVIDGAALQAGGIHALWLRADGSLHWRTARDWQKQRPWNAVE